MICHFVLEMLHEFFMIFILLSFEWQKLHSVHLERRWKFFFLFFGECVEQKIFSSMTILDIQMKVNINYGEIEKFRAVVVLRFLESESNDGDDVEDDQRNFICNSIQFHSISFNLYAVYMRFEMTHESSSIKMTCSS